MQQRASTPDPATALWPAYIRVTLGQPPHQLLLGALTRMAAETPPAGRRRAVDLGCGAGNDTVELLRQGWSVVAIDKTPEAIECLLQRPDLPGRDHLETVLADLVDARWPPVDLANAHASLPFLAPPAFATVWQKVVNSLAPGGRFVGHFFGDRDDWAQIPGRTHHTRALVEMLLEPFDVEHLEEVERDGQSFPGIPKHWHRFEVAARKR